jgi:anti-sigma28 factor (negative regulator of flagellin synthesis)
MKVNDHGFTERVATAATPAPAIVSALNSSSSADAPAAANGDDLQLSGFAARLNSGMGADAASRAERVSQVANAVNVGTFQIDSAAVSGSIVSEALQSKG